MTTVIKIGKVLGYIIGGFMLLIVLYFIFARVLSSITLNKKQADNDDVTMYISTNGMHTDYVFPIKSEYIDWSKKFPFENTKSKNTNQNYVAIGWGDKGFFLDVDTWDNVKPSIAINAALGLGTTALHVTYLNNVSEDKDCKKITISAEQYKSLIHYVEQSLKNNEEHQPILIVTDKVYGNNDAFYEARGSYSFLYTCNTWANTGLKKSKMKCCLWTPFQEGIFRKY